MSAIDKPEIQLKWVLDQLGQIDNTIQALASQADIDSLRISISSIRTQLGDTEFQSFLATMFSLGSLVLSAIVLYKVW